MSQPTLKEAFEKALSLAIENYEFGDRAIPAEAEQYALWAARWIAERCLRVFDSHSNVNVIEKEILRLAKELE